MGEKEREHDQSALRKEIATLVAEKCVDPATQRPYPVGMIEKAMSEAGYSLKPNKNAKSQVCLSSRPSCNHAHRNLRYRIALKAFNPIQPFPYSVHACVSV